MSLSILHERCMLTCSSYAALRLGASLFPLFALALDLPENYFDDKVMLGIPDLGIASLMLIRRLPNPPPSCGYCTTLRKQVK